MEYLCADHNAKQACAARRRSLRATAGVGLQTPATLKSDPSSSSDVSRDPDAVRTMFGRIAGRYDLANHLLSGGADLLWRKRAAQIVEGWKPQSVLDLASGSGDLALAIQHRLPEAKITAADFSPEM